MINLLRFIVATLIALMSISVNAGIYIGELDTQTEDPLITYSIGGLTGSSDTGDTPVTMCKKYILGLPDYVFAEFEGVYIPKYIGVNERSNAGGDSNIKLHSCNFTNPLIIHNPPTPAYIGYEPAYNTIIESYGCDAGFEFNAETLTCEKSECPAPYSFNTITDRCEMYCRDDQTIDTSTEVHQCKDKPPSGGTCDPDDPPIEGYYAYNRGTFDNVDDACAAYGYNDLSYVEYTGATPNATQSREMDCNFLWYESSEKTIGVTIVFKECPEEEEQACPDGLQKNEDGTCDRPCPDGYKKQGDTCVLDPDANGDGGDGGDGDGGDGDGGDGGDGNGDGSGDGDGDGSGDGDGDGDGGDGNGNNGVNGDGEPCVIGIDIDCKPKSDGNGGDGGDGDGGDGGDGFPEFCDWAQTLCDFVDDIGVNPDTPDVDDLPEIKNIEGLEGFDINQDYVNASGECPQSETISLMGGSISLSYEPLCLILEKLAPILVACSYLTGAYMIIRSL